MNTSRVLPRERMDPLGMIQKFSKMPSGALQDEGPDKNTEDSLCVDSTARTFPRFNDLPPHIRAKIWRMAWLTRVVTPFASKPAPKFTICRNPQRCERCQVDLFRPRTIAPAMMYACREARREVQEIARPLSKWSYELWMTSNLYPSWRSAQFAKFLDESAYRDERLRTTIWFNPAVDNVHIGTESLLLMAQQSGPLNYDDVLQAALDPALVLMLHAELFEEHDALQSEFRDMRFGLRSLYHQYLKPREHIYICEREQTFVLSDEGLQKAVQEGLFSGEDQETRLVATSDTALISKYEDLGRIYDTHHTNPTTFSTIRYWTIHFNTWFTRKLQDLKLRRKPEAPIGWATSQGVQSVHVPLSGAQLLMLKIADFLMWDRGLGFGRGTEIMDFRGHLMKDHPLVQEQGFKLPDFTPVIAYHINKRQRHDCSAMLDRLPAMRLPIPYENLPNLVLYMLEQKNSLLRLLGVPI